MNKLSNEELIKISGGTMQITASLLNAVVKCFDTLLELGRTIGSSIRRISSGKICS